jgi:uncharacterized protein YdcH (DUF465 family)
MAKETDSTKIELKTNDNLVVNTTNALDLISDDSLLGVYNEIMENLRGDRTHIGELADKFEDMVINEGDSSTSSKEALVNLNKHKSDIQDKMTKIAELMTRVKLKQPYGEAKGYLNKGQGNNGPKTINIYDQSGFNKKTLIEKVRAASEKKENNET